MQNRFTAPQSGEIDVLVRSTTWTPGREARLGMPFGPPDFYDGQGFMVKKAPGVSSATGLNLQDDSRSRTMTLRPVVIADTEEICSAFPSGRCDACTGDRSSLVAFRARQGPNAENYVILPEVISKEPLAPSVRKGDDNCFDIVRRTFFAQIAAEAMASRARTSAASRPRRTPICAASPASRAIPARRPAPTAAGPAMSSNRSAITAGSGTGRWARSVSRSVNTPWRQGGLLYAPPIRRVSLRGRGYLAPAAGAGVDPRPPLAHSPGGRT